MPIYTPKERRAHYSGVANGTIAPKQGGKFSDAEQIAYAKGQRDARNDANMGYLLGANSPLSAEEKTRIKAERKVKRQAYFSGPDKSTKKSK